MYYIHVWWTFIVGNYKYGFWLHICGYPLLKESDWGLLTLVFHFCERLKLILQPQEINRNLCVHVHNFYVLKGYFNFISLVKDSLIDLTPVSES